MPEDVSFELGLLLTAMSTTAGMLALSLSFQCAAPFYALNFTSRELFLQGLNNSMIGLKRKAFVSLRQLICIKAFGNGPTNPLWTSFGFQGPRTTNDVLFSQKQKQDGKGGEGGKEGEEGEEEKGSAIPALKTDPVASPEFDFSPYIVTVEEAKRNSSNSPLYYDAIIVGSGCGGSVVCERLASQGKKVLLIEKGRYLHRNEMTGSEEMFDQLYERGGLCVTDDTAMAVLAGSAFGGGTAVNWACCLEPPRYVREEWATKHGLRKFILPAFQHSLDTVCERLGVVGGRYGGRLDQNVNNQMLIDGCHNMGYHVRVAPNNMVQNAQSEKDRGEVGVGDRHGLKQSMVETYLKDAFQTGNVDLLDQTEAVEILHEENNNGLGKNRAVKGVLVSSSLGLENVKEEMLFAKVVVVSGGSINSPALLLRTEQTSSFCDFNESGMLGRNLRLHPVVGIMALSDHVVDIWNGAPMTTGK